MEPSLFPKIFPLFLAPPYPGFLAPPGHGKGTLIPGKGFGNCHSLASHASEGMLWGGRKEGPSYRCRAELVFWKGWDHLLWILQKGSGMMLKRYSSRLKKYQNLGVGGCQRNQGSQGKFVPVFLISKCLRSPAEIPCCSEALEPIVAMLSNPRGNIYFVPHDALWG